MSHMSGNVGNFGNEFAETSTHARYQDDDFVIGDIGFAFYTPENKQLLQEVFQEAILKNYNYVVGQQDEFALLDQMHEAFWDLHEMMFTRKKVRVNANLQKTSIKGYQWDTTDDEKRGILNPTGHKSNVSIATDRHDEEMTKEEVIKLLNRKALSNMMRIAVEKIETYKNYNKIYNRKVDEILYTGKFWSRPEGEGTNRQRRMPCVEPFRYKPRTYTEDIIKYNY